MNNHIDIIFFGDSLTFGYGVSKEKSWVYLIANKLNLSYINNGKNGDTTPSMLSRFYSDALKYNPHTIFIMGGTNDLLCGRSISSIIENIEIMIQDSYNINAKVIIGIPPKIIGSMANELFIPSSFYSYAEKSLTQLRDSLILLSHKYKTNIIDFYSLELTQDLYIDGLHLSSEGNNIMYKEAVKILN